MADSSFPEFIDLDDDDVDEGNSASLSTGNARMGNKATKLSKTLGSNAVQGDMLPDVLDDLAMQAQTTKAACVKSLIAVFPGISREYVSQMYEAEADKGFGLADLLVEKILSASTSAPYPREAEKTRKRKRQSDARPAAQHHLQYESAQRGPVTSRYHELAKDILGDEFPFMPLAYIESVLLVHRYVFQSYMQLKKAEAAPDSQQLSPYKKLKSARQPKERRKRGSRVEAEAHSKSLHPPEDKTLKDLIQEMDTARNKFRQDDDLTDIRSLTLIRVLVCVQQKLDRPRKLPHLQSSKTKKNIKKQD
ncbi:MAG: hypothetical protein M1837_007402 [Sclerophora amabilis]|nr:MAG: hypothetical protein M1837_007402 [Sclerophora amabilis]